ATCLAGSNDSAVARRRRGTGPAPPRSAGAAATFADRPRAWSPAPARPPGCPSAARSAAGHHAEDAVALAGAAYRADAADRRGAAYLVDRPGAAGPLCRAGPARRSGRPCSAVCCPPLTCSPFPSRAGGGGEHFLGRASDVPANEELRRGAAAIREHDRRVACEPFAARALERRAAEPILKFVVGHRDDFLER